jgi:hypothetical protein
VLKKRLAESKGLGQHDVGMEYDENAPLFSMPTKSRMTALQKSETTFHAYNYAWPSPRSWEIALRAYAACNAVNARPSVKMKMMCGSIGTPLCLVWVSWLASNQGIPSPDRLLGGQTYTPTNASQAGAVLNAMLQFGLEKNRTPEVVEWIKRNSPEGRGDGLRWDWIVTAAHVLKGSPAKRRAEADRAADELVRWANAMMVEGDDEFAPAPGTGAGVY